MNQTESAPERTQKMGWLPEPEIEDQGWTGPKRQPALSDNAPDARTGIG